MNRWYKMNDRQILLNKLKTTTILIVEDGSDILNLLEYSFKLLMKEIKTAQNGIEALEVLNNFTPSVILTDLNMPNMNGSEMIKQIKKMNPNIPIIVMSGYANDLDCPELVEAVFDKPANFSDIMTAIAKVTQD